MKLEERKERNGFIKNLNGGGFLLSLYFLDPLAAAEEGEGDDDDNEDEAHDDVEGMGAALEGHRDVHAVDAGDYCGEGEDDR